MDGRVYNYNTGPWNPCNENFQAACLELQNPGIPTSRDGHGMVRDPSKAMATAPSFMFLNYPTTEEHIVHSSNQHAMHRAAATAAQWQIPQWPKMKAHPSHGHKNFGMMKDDWSSSGMAPSMHPGHASIFNIPPPGPFCSTDITDTLQDNCVLNNTHQHPQHQQNSAAVSYASHGTTTTVETQQPVQNPAPPKPVVKKSNPQPRKKRERKKVDKEKKKRTRNEESWARNKRKKARARGESYMSVVGKVMRAKEVQPVDCSKCKFHCPAQVTEDDRQKLFEHYWSLESFKDKVNFLSDCVEEFVPLRPISGKRLYSRRYKLKIGEGDDEKIARVCKEFFISTFDISESTIVTFMNKKRKNPEEIKDNRGHQIPSNKTPPEVVQSIREHILSQTGLQGCLTKFHLEEVRNIKRLYTHYQVECEVEDRKPASMSVYRKVYGDMHKDKTEAPVILPPEDVLDKISPSKKSKVTIKDETPPPPVPQVNEDLDLVDDNEDDDGGDDDDDIDDDDDDAGEPHPVEPLNLTPPSLGQPPNSQPPQPHQQTVPPPPSSSSSSSPSSCSLASQPGTSSHEIVMSAAHHQNQHQHHHHHHHHHQNHNHHHPHNHHHHHNQISRQMMEDKSYSLNIPLSSSASAHPQSILDNSTGQVVGVADSSNTIMAPSFDTSGAHINQIMPLMWGNQGADVAASIRNMQPSFVTTPNAFSNPNPMHHMAQSCLFSNPNTVSGAALSSTSSTNHAAFSVSTVQPMTLSDPSFSIRGDEEVVVVKKLKKPSRPRVKSKPKPDVKKRTRNEESWGRNIRKRLRFKGEEYISVKGKTVGAKKVQKVDCSKCKYKCKSKITEDQRVEMNDKYWKLEDYEQRIEFISRYVQTYVPKRKMTGRRAYSRNYTFIVDKKHIRVCKNFFISTLHISESIVATCLKKARKGPSASKDMRGKHKPVNKTSEEVLQSIRELIIYLTGVRPRRKGNKASKVAQEYQDINRLYLIYKYDSQQKGKKIASHGIFRNILSSEFGFTGNSKFKKSLISKMNAANNSKREGRSYEASTAIVVAKPLKNEPSAVPQHTKSSQAPSSGSVVAGTDTTPTITNQTTSLPPSSNKQPEIVEVYEGSSTHPVFSTCLLSSF